MSEIALGVTGKISHNEKLAKEYNELLETCGIEDMLQYWEEQADDSDLRSVIEWAKDRIYTDKCNKVDKLLGELLTRIGVQHDPEHYNNILRYIIENVGNDVTYRNISKFYVLFVKKELLECITHMS